MLINRQITKKSLPKSDNRAHCESFKIWMVYSHRRTDNVAILDDGNNLLRVITDIHVWDLGNIIRQNCRKNPWRVVTTILCYWWETWHQVQSWYVTPSCSWRDRSSNFSSENFSSYLWWGNHHRSLGGLSPLSILVWCSKEASSNEFRNLLLSLAA